MRGWLLFLALLRRAFCLIFIAVILARTVGILILVRPFILILVRLIF